MLTQKRLKWINENTYVLVDWSKSSINYQTNYKRPIQVICKVNEFLID